MGDAEGHRVDSSVIGGHNIQIGSAAGDVTVVLERSRFRLELLAPSPVPERIPRSQRTPSHLLDVRRQVVPYRPRPTLEQALHTWRDDDEPVSVRLASGPGGAGKTRLAGWLATRSHDDGWTVLLASDTSTTLPPAAATHALAEDGRPLLAVVDYAERWPLESLTELVETLAAQHRVTGVRVRVLLLARPQREFWEGVAAQLERAWVDLAQPIAVEAFITGPEELSEAFTSAAGAFQAALELPVGPVPVPRGLSPEGGISPLTVHMAALAAVCATAEGEAVPQSEDLSGFLLAHERRYWKDPPGARVMSTMVMVATLFGPTSAGEQARQWLIRARLAADDTEAEHLLTAHHRLYPPLPDPAPDMTSVSQARPAPDTARVELLTPLKPDRFAEDFLAAHLIEPRAAVLLAELLTDPATASAQRQAFLVLSAAAARHTTARRALFAVLEAGPIPTAWLSPTLISTVISHAPDHLAARVETAIPDHHTNLLRPARDLSQHLLQRLAPTASFADCAHRLHNLGVRLAAVGELRAALEPVREAVKIYRALAEAEPAAYLPALAMSLNNLGVRLAEVGEQRDALELAREAVKIYRALAEAEPAAYLPTLAGSLNNLGNCLAEVGEQRDALQPVREAVEIRRRLAEAEPAAYLPTLALSLNTLGNRLAEVGEQRDALELVREAVEIRRRLAGAEPAAYLPALAMSLNNLGVRLAEVGEQRDALELAREAVKIYRALAEAEPAAYLPTLAMSLNNLGVRLAVVGEQRDALQPVREAVEIRRRLAEAEPAAYLPALAASLNNLGNCLAAVGEQRDALELAREAVEIRRRLAEAEPAAYLPTLAMSLNNLSVRLAEAGEQRDALQPVREAVEIRRRLAEAEPAAYLPALAASLNNLGNCLAAVGGQRDALQPAREAVKIYRALAEAEPAAYLPDLAMSLNNFGNRLAEAGEQRDALELVREAVKIRRRLAEAEPAAYLPDLASSLWAAAWIRNAHAVELEKAVTAVDEAIAIYRKLAEQAPATFNDILAATEQTRAEILNQLKSTP